MELATDTPAEAHAPAATDHAPDTAQQAAPEAQKAEAPAAPVDDADLEKIWAKHNPARGEKGQFAAKADGAPEASDKGNDALSPGAQPETKSMPASWSKASEAVWKSLTPEAQDMVLKREADGEKGVQALKQQYEPLKGIAHAIEPHKALLAQMGLSPEQGVERLIGFHSRMMSDPYRGIIDVAAAYNVDLNRLFAPQGQRPGENSAIDQLEAKIRTLEAELAADKQAKAHAFTSDLEKQVNDFASKPDHKYFDQLRPVMARLLQSGQAADLADAYKQAARLDDEVWSAMEREKREAESSKERAASAKRSAAINVRSSPAGSPRKSSEDDLKEIAARYYG